MSSGNRFPIVLCPDVQPLYNLCGTWRTIFCSRFPRFELEVLQLLFKTVKSRNTGEDWKRSILNKIKVICKMMHDTLCLIALVIDIIQHVLYFDNRRVWHMEKELSKNNFVDHSNCLDETNYWRPSLLFLTVNIWWDGVLGVESNSINQTCQSKDKILHYTNM